MENPNSKSEMKRLAIQKGLAPGQSVALEILHTKAAHVWNWLIGLPDDCVVTVTHTDSEMRLTAKNPEGHFIPSVQLVVPK